MIRDLAEEGRTMLLVTHENALRPRRVEPRQFLHQGRVEEEGSPQQVFNNPVSARTREFTGALAN